MSVWIISPYIYTRESLVSQPLIQPPQPQKWMHVCRKLTIYNKTAKMNTKTDRDRLFIVFLNKPTYKNEVLNQLHASRRILSLLYIYRDGSRGGWQGQGPFNFKKQKKNIR
jgi:hypothetical protein